MKKIENTKLKSFTARDLCQTALFTALIAACAQVSFPLPGGIPVTLQTFAVMLAGIVLGAKKGTLAVLIYILLAAIGIPVLSNMTGGLGIVFGRTGGFILSFPIMTVITGFAESRRNKLLLAAGLISAVIVNYISGTVYFSLLTGSGLRTAFMVCVLPFIAGDAVKMVMAAVFGRSLKAILKKTGMSV